MCGFAFSYSTENETHASEHIGRISNRGPDEVRVLEFKDENFEVSFCRLAIRELSAGAQPLVHEHFISCFNGELYNQHEIETLIRSWYPTISIPKGDMNVLALFLFLTDGKGINQVIGMFAGFIYFRNLGIVKLFRDRTGEKPVYYKISEQSVNVLSEYRFLDKSGKSEENIELSCRELLQGFWENNRFEDVKSCPPGSIVSISLSSGETIVKSYWEWPRRIQGESLCDLMSFEAILDQVIESQLVADVPIAILLSSGIDSSLITSIANEKLPGKLTAFTLGFEDLGWDETDRAQKIAEFLDINHQVICYSYEELASFIPKVVEAMDVPIFDPAAISMFALCKAVSRSHKVAIGGDGGDELFQGYDLIAHEKKLNWLRSYFPIQAIPKKVTKFLMEMPTGNYNSNRMKFARGISVLHGTHLPLPMSALSPFAGTSLISKFNPFLNTTHFDNFSISAESYYQEKILPSVYLVKSDRMSMAHSLELRSPLLDHRLIEASMNLSSKDLKKYGRKSLLGKIAEKRFPLELLQKRKHGFSPPFTKIIRHLPEPEWEYPLTRIFQDELKSLWRRAESNQNQAIAAWTMFVCNYFIRYRNLNLEINED